MIGVADVELALDGEQHARPSRSRTMLWAPKPSVAPMTVAPASSGVRLRPMVPRMTKKAMTPTTPRQTLASRLVRVRARAAARGESARATALWAAAPTQRRMIRLPSQPMSDRHQDDQQDRERLDDDLLPVRGGGLAHAGPAQDVVEPALVDHDG